MTKAFTCVFIMVGFAACSGTSEHPSPWMYDVPDATGDPDIYQWPEPDVISNVLDAATVDVVIEDVKNEPDVKQHVPHDSGKDSGYVDASVMDSSSSDSATDSEADAIADVIVRDVVPDSRTEDVKVEDVVDAGSVIACEEHHVVIDSTCTCNILSGPRESGRQCIVYMKCGEGGNFFGVIESNTLQLYLEGSNVPHLSTLYVPTSDGNGCIVQAEISR